MQHIKIIKFQLFIPFNIFSLYICLIVQILFYFTFFLASQMLDPQRLLWKKHSDWDTAPFFLLQDQCLTIGRI